MTCTDFQTSNKRPPNSRMNIRHSQYALPQSRFSNSKGYSLPRTILTGSKSAIPPTLEVILLTSPPNNSTQTYVLATRLAKVLEFTHVDLQQRILDIVRKPGPGEKLRVSRLREQCGDIHPLALMRCVQQKMLPGVRFVLDILKRKIDEEVKGGENRRFIITGLPENGFVLKGFAEKIALPNAVILLGIPRVWKSKPALHRRDVKDIFQGRTLEVDVDKMDPQRAYEAVLEAMFDRATQGLTPQQVAKLVAEGRESDAMRGSNPAREPRADSFFDAGSLNSEPKVETIHEATIVPEESHVEASTCPTTTLMNPAQPCDLQLPVKPSDRPRVEAGPSPSLRRKSTDLHEIGNDSDDIDGRGVGRKYKKRKSDISDAIELMEA